MHEAPTPQDKSPRRVRQMFAAVAPAYDRLNHVLSLSLDRLWRRRCARSLRGVEGPVLDLCCGTGDLSVALRRQGLEVVAADFCFPMVQRAGPKFGRFETSPPRPLTADALELPFADGAFAGVSVSFGVRNVVDLDAALGEIARVLRPAGRLAILEFALPESPILRDSYLFYFRRILPRIGRLVSRHQSAYDYLPDSVVEFPQRRRFTERLEAAGLVETSWHDYSAGTVCLYSARKSQRSTPPTGTRR